MGNLFSQSIDLSDKDLVVIVIGQAGAGKSSFINAVAGATLPVGHNLQCCTKKVQSVTAGWRGRKIVFVDTPAFDIDIDVNAEANLRRKIEKWQKKTSTQNHVVAGIIYLHKISETRITEPPHKRIKTFERLCGGSLSEKVLLVTTMWNEVDQAVGTSREQQIRANYWESPTTNRATMARFDDKTDSTQAWRAVDLLLEGSGTDATRR